MKIRNALISDLRDIIQIYNASIPTRIATADTEPITIESRLDWFAKHNAESRPLWVLASEQGVIAWIGLTSFYGGRPAYNATAEVSIYIAPQHQGKGYGTMLVRRMIEYCPSLNVTTLLAMYFDHNDASRRMFEKLGFQQKGHLPEIAVLDGKKYGLVIAAYKIAE
ncbi:GNAT family N-acetyltransferase [Gloeocapsopsis dulcis]|uniref:N-acetyltransferase n=1 Tax=Gloeocapsopsis dulcis AAB1 = 1H9 TaxID=1433147 RepID=A0A6N8FXE1_9CHRO|nr:GNAT family N-acetyltransferase [Gloeocapsopsis dulcis]MUL36596.1 N-acetyltransferase [Gloeocapsopsis dulcis AAB1 = 1H9]WNN87221.1 GNAT family N-acetyltransferase [Gloeocapsopsis dulcis]